MVDDKVSSEPERDIEMEELREELARLKEALSDRMQEARELVSERAALVRENPATFSAALVLGGAIGLMLGLALGGDSGHKRWR